MEEKDLPVISVEYYDYRDLLSDMYTRKDTKKIVKALAPPKELMQKVHHKRNLCYPIYQDDDGVYWITVTDILVPNEFKRPIIKKMGYRIKKICDETANIGMRLTMTVLALCQMKNFNEFIYDGGPDSPTYAPMGYVSMQVMKSCFFEYETPQYNPVTGDVKMKCKIFEHMRELFPGTSIRDFAMVNLNHPQERTKDE